MAIRVKAVRRVGYQRYVGFYGKLMQHGEVFEISDPKQFSARWMEPADDDARRALKGVFGVESSKPSTVGASR